MKRVLLIMLAICSLVSCSKEGEGIVINSTILDTGSSETITEKHKSNPDGSRNTLLEYTSWIRLQLETKAMKDKELSVVVAGSFNDVIDSVDVEHLAIGTPTTSIEYQMNDGRQQGNIIILDSMMVYSVVFEKMSFNYKLHYEVPIYNDGFTKQEMPYHRIEFVKDNGYTVEEADPQFDGMKIYACRLLKHSITILFKDKEYTVSAKILYRKLMATNGQPVIISSQKIDEGIEIRDAEQLYYHSWIKMRQKWSDKKVDEVVYQARIGTDVRFDNSDLIGKLITSPELNFTDPTLINITQEDGGVGDSEYVDIKTNTRKYAVSCAEFALRFYATEPIPYYDDGIVKYEMPVFTYDKDSFKFLYHIEKMGDDILNGQPAQAYALFISLTWSINGKEYSSREENISLYTYK